MHDTVGVIGLGNMGGAIAASLTKNGFAVAGFDIDSEALERAADNGVECPKSIIGVSETAGIIILSLANPSALYDVTAELASTGQTDLIVVETGTFSLTDKEGVQDRLMEAGIAALDCPVSGTGQQARTGDLLVFTSGDEDTVRRCQPVFDGFSRDQKYCGAFGNGSRMKYVANHLIAIHNVATAEAMALGLKSGLDPKLVFDVNSNSAATNRMFEVRGKLMAESNWGDIGATNKLFQKDLDVISEHLVNIACPLPLFDVAVKPHRDAMQRGLAERDPAAIGLLIEEAVGLDRDNWPPDAIKLKS